MIFVLICLMMALETAKTYSIHVGCN